MQRASLAELETSVGHIVPIDEAQEALDSRIGVLTPTMFHLLFEWHVNKCSFFKLQISCLAWSYFPRSWFGR